jgi:hypothetical protein
VEGAADFRLAILARSENGGHPWPPPSGFPVRSPAGRLREIKSMRA